jgi:hypothetical protein
MNRVHVPSECQTPLWFVRALMALVVIHEDEQRYV